MTKARDLANSAAAFAAVSATELGYVDGVTSAIQTQIDAKAPSSTAVTLTGTQTLTNKTLTSPVIASVINNTLTSTTGDTIYASAANTPARLGIGSTGQVLTVASGLPSWATPSSGGMSVISSGSLSSTSTLISGIPATYIDLVLYIANYTTTVQGWAADIRLNDDATTNRHFTTSGIPIGASTAFNDTKILMTVDNGNVSSSSNSLICVNIPNYANATTWKLVQCLAVTQVTATPTNFYFQDGGGIYNQTAAISSLRILPNSGATIGGTYILYGVK